MPAPPHVSDMQSGGRSVGLRPVGGVQFASKLTALFGESMTSRAYSTSHVAATVVHVHPVTGLAYLEGDDHRSWAITKSTAGAGLDTLRPGHRIDLTVISSPGFDIVSAYGPLD